MMTRFGHEILKILYWSLLQPASFRRAVADGRIELERARWEGLALVIGVPVVALLLLHGIDSVVQIPFDPAGARTFAHVSIAIASVFCLVGSVPEGVAFGVVGGLVGVVVGSAAIWWIPFPFDLSILFGAALGMASRTRHSTAGTWWTGLREAVQGGLIFAIVFGLEEGGLLFFSSWPGSELVPALLRAVERFVTTAWQTGTYFVLSFLLLYLGVLWYPVEFVWAVLARNRHPAHFDHLSKLPLPSPAIVGEDTNSQSL